MYRCVLVVSGLFSMREQYSTLKISLRLQRLMDSVLVVIWFLFLHIKVLATLGLNGIKHPPGNSFMQLTNFQQKCQIELYNTKVTKSPYVVLTLMIII